MLIVLLHPTCWRAVETLDGRGFANFDRESSAASISLSRWNMLRRDPDLLHSSRDSVFLINRCRRFSRILDFRETCLHHVPFATVAK